MRLAQVVHRIVTDSEFAASIAQDPEAALHRPDIDLTEGELQALLTALAARGRRPDHPQPNHTWYEFAPSARRPDDPQPNHTWYEFAPSTRRPNDPQPNHTWYESQLGAETT